MKFAASPLVLRRSSEESRYTKGLQLTSNRYHEQPKASSEGEDKDKERRKGKRCLKAQPHLVEPFVSQLSSLIESTFSDAWQALSEDVR